MVNWNFKSYSDKKCYKRYLLLLQMFKSSKRKYTCEY